MTLQKSADTNLVDIKLYFTRHCDKAACFDDLVPYLQQLVKSAESTSDVLVFLSARKYEPGQSLNVRD